MNNCAKTELSAICACVIKLCVLKLYFRQKSELTTSNVFLCMLYFLKNKCLYFILKNLMRFFWKVWITASSVIFKWLDFAIISLEPYIRCLFSEMSLLMYLGVSSYVLFVCFRDVILFFWIEFVAKQNWMPAQ